MSNQLNDDPFFGKVISVYTRAQALADGVLIDAGPMAREAGFRWPVAITAAAWADCVTWSDADSERRDSSGSIRSLCQGCYLFIAADAGADPAPTQARQLLFELYRVPLPATAAPPKPSAPR